MKRRCLFSCFLMCYVLLACQNNPNQKSNPFIIPVATPVTPLMSAVLDSMEDEIYGDLPDSIVAELKLMDSLLTELDGKVTLINEDELRSEEEDNAIYQADLRRVDSIALEEWKTLKPRAFKKRQLSFERVKEIYANNANYVKKLLLSKGIYSFNIDLYLRAFKEDRTLEVWVKPKAQKNYQLLITYPFYLGMSELGPKKRQGDEQVPEGFYRIDYFNPESSYKVSLKINYPNRSDAIRNAKETDIGGDICIHGHRASVGCLAITDERIPNVYLLAVEAMDQGQQEIPIHIFPTRFENDNLTRITKKWAEHPDYIALWESMKPAYDYFQQTQCLPKVKTMRNGLYGKP